MRWAKTPASGSALPPADNPSGEPRLLILEPGPKNWERVIARESQYGVVNLTEFSKLPKRGVLLLLGPVNKLEYCPKSGANNGWW
jgi:hypothetical protein